jgi:hypothetical protein
VFIVVYVYFNIDSVRKLLGTPSYTGIRERNRGLHLAVRYQKQRGYVTFLGHDILRPTNTFSFCRSEFLTLTNIWLQPNNFPIYIDLVILSSDVFVQLHATMHKMWPLFFKTSFKQEKHAPFL